MTCIAGDYYHGNPRKYPADEYNKTCKRAMGELYEKTCKRRATIESLGYSKPGDLAAECPKYAQASADASDAT